MLLEIVLYAKIYIFKLFNFWKIFSKLCMLRWMEHGACSDCIQTTSDKDDDCLFWRRLLGEKVELLWGLIRQCVYYCKYTAVVVSGSSLSSHSLSLCRWFIFIAASYVRENVPTKTEKEATRQVFRCVRKRDFAWWRNQCLSGMRTWSSWWVEKKEGIFSMSAPTRYADWMRQPIKHISVFVSDEW